MTMSSIMPKVVDILMDIFENQDLQITAETTALMVPGWDSMAQIKILMAVEEEFLIHFSSREMDKLRNVGDLVAAIARQTGKAS
jgi:acyl carrier protein